ncbi:polyphenol oxidase family protein [Persephonella sp.]
MYYLKIKNLNVCVTTSDEGNMRIPSNRLNVLQKFGFSDVFIPDQKHTNKVITLDEKNCCADGAVTDRLNFPVGVLTADCMAVVISDFKKLAVVHAGWRGLFSGIIENTLEFFRYKNDLTVFISPSAEACCYEVGTDFLKNGEKLGISSEYFSRNDGKIYFSMKRLLTDILGRYGIRKIIDVSLCSICNEEFFSYRRGNREERFLTFSWLSEE